MMELRGLNITAHINERCVEAGKLKKQFQHTNHVNESMIHRLGLEKELEGHRGCVNCLEWNHDGSLLASGSDDLHAIIWDPHRHKQICTLRTGHHGNVFSVKFLPNSNDSSIVSAAGDCKVHVHSIPKLETSEVYSCHVGRVKRLATAPNVPYMFWSAGEDGTVRQFDLRTPHNCSEKCSNVIVNLNAYIGRHAECKCLAINQCRPEQLAVGASDPYVRLYDLRMLSPHDVSFSHLEWLGHSWHSPTAEPDNQAKVPNNCVQYFIAGHLPAKESSRRGYRTLAITYLTFGPKGNELLVNIGGEQVYLFDVNKARHPKLFTVGDYPLRPGTNGVHKKDVSDHVAEVLSSNGTTNGVSRLHLAQSNGFHKVSSSDLSTSSISKSTQPDRGDSYIRNKPLPFRAELLKLEANKHYCDRKDFTAAIRLYNQAISISPHSAVLYGNRAAAYMKRRWDGDLYASIRDCHSALQLDPSHRKAHFRLTRGLLELTWIKEAQDCLEHFKDKFPEYTQYRECRALENDIRRAASTMKESDTLEAEKKTPSGSNIRNSSPVRDLHLSEHEKDVREQAFDYQERFCGHCNTTTDIKEANFFGSDGQYIMAGSDDGSFFIWDRKTTNIIRVLRGDDSIVNCLQPHPTTCLLASSGIDPVVRLWSPRPEDGSMEERCIQEADSAATANQRRMKADPFEVMLLNMGLSTATVPGDNSDEEGTERPVHCQQS